MDTKLSPEFRNGLSPLHIAAMERMAFNIVHELLKLVLNFKILNSFGNPH